MDLATILQKVDSHAYMTCKEYLRDIDLVTSNALQYNPTHDQLGKTIRQRACELCDYAHSAIRSQLEPEFEKVRGHVMQTWSSDWLIGPLLITVLLLLS